MRARSPSRAFSLVELLVVVSILALLLTLSLPSLRRVREQGRTLVCVHNLRQWNLIFQTYGQENDGQFFRAGDAQGFWWLDNLDDTLRDWEANRLWFCPSATKPLFDRTGNLVGTWNITNAWGIFRESGTGARLGRRGIAGSYGVNGYFIRIPRGTTYQSGVRADQGWRRINTVTRAANVPVAVDALRFDLWPRATDPPARYEFSAWTSNNHMARTCINRHRGTVGCTFADGSARKVGLKELWKLQWYRDFNTNGPWTLAGHVKPEHWPEWLRAYPDY